VAATDQVKRDFTFSSLVCKIQLLVYADDVKLLGDNIDTVKKNRNSN
jgi:hypothetical protein